MKSTTMRRSLGLLMLFFLVTPDRARSATEDFTYAIEVQGQLCGYSDVHCESVEDEDGPYTRISQKIFLLLSVLDFELHREIRAVYHVDPETLALRYSEFHVDTGRLPARQPDPDRGRPRDV